MTSKNLRLRLKLRKGAALNPQLLKKLAKLPCFALFKLPYKPKFDAIHLNIFTKDGSIFTIAMPDAQNVMGVLKEKDRL